MATVGRLNIFDSHNESWEQYAERLTAYFVANGIDDVETRKAVLQTVLSPETYKLLRDRIRPSKMADKTYSQLVDVLHKHFNPKPLRCIARLRFHRRYRRADESVEAYIAELQNLTEHCNFDKSEEMIVDQIIFGIGNDVMQQRLIAEEEEKKTITLARATTLLIAMENSKRNIGEIRSEDTAKEAQVNVVHTKEGSRSSRELQFQKDQKNNRQAAYKTANKERRDTRPTPDFSKCVRCANPDHYTRNCPYINARCSKCDRIGHLARACLHPPEKPERDNPRKSHQANFVQTGNSDESIQIHHFSEYDVDVCQIREQSRNQRQVVHIREAKLHNRGSDQQPLPWTVNVVQNVTRSKEEVPPPDIVTLGVNGTHVTFQVDNGSGYTMMTQKEFQRLEPPIRVMQFSRKLESYTGNEVKIIGLAEVRVTFGVEKETLPMLIVDTNGPNLCGRKWLFSKLNILPSISRHRTQIHAIKDEPEIEEILEKHAELFTPGLGKVKNIEAHLHLKPEATPKFCKARTIPYARKDAVEKELRRMEAEGIIEKIDYSAYASPIVTVQKPSGGIRICADFKSTINPMLNIDSYPLPKAEDIFASLAGCRVFLKLDLKEAYNQIQLDEESRKYAVINTTLGLFRFNRLPFGVASASAIFQRIMETILNDVHQVTPFQDDTLIGGRNKREHLQILDKVLQKLRDFGLKLKKEKCKFLQTEIEFLGHTLNEYGIHPQNQKMTAIMDAPAPRNVETLRSFLGLLNYYARFVPRNATRLAPLYALLKKDAAWTWGDQEATAFLEAKKAIKSSGVLVHYDVKKEITIASDASPTGIGAVISHIIDGVERPIAFASRSLTSTERNYSQLDREGLAVIFAVKKFKDYIYGKRFVIYTDHQPLITLFAADKPVPPMAAARIQRWSLIMAAYSYEIRFRKGSANANADALSRSPLPIGNSVNTPVPVEYVFVLKDTTNQGPVTSQELAESTIADQTLITVRDYMTHGWPRSKVPSKLELFQKRKNDLSTFGDILLMGNRLVIPEALRKSFLQELHGSHQGIVAMKAVARSRFWWPQIDKDIESISKSCPSCQQHTNMPAARYHPWPTSKKPWERVHADFAGPVNGRYLLIVVDTYSKWIEVAITASQTSHAVITFIRELITRFGIMNTLVTDNGTCFTSTEFSSFIKENGITHLRSAPYHPASNGTAERSVRTIKDQLKKISHVSVAENVIKNGLNTHTAGSLEKRIAIILFNHRRTPTSTGHSPAELMLGRKVTTRLDICHPKNATQMRTVDKPKYSVNDYVYVRNFGSGDKWIPGSIDNVMGNMMYSINTNHGKMRRHRNQVRPREECCIDLTSNNISADIDPSHGHLELSSYAQEESEIPEPVDTQTPADGPKTSNDAPQSSSPRQLSSIVPRARHVSSTEPSSDIIQEPLDITATSIARRKGQRTRKTPAWYQPS